jgi:hypothetical protein
MKLVLTAALVAACTAAAAQTPAAALLKPPPAAKIFTILSLSAHHGKTFVWTTPAGARCSRESFNLRGFINDTDQCITLGAGGTVRALTIRGTTPSGDAAENFAWDHGTARWHSPVDGGAKPAPPAAIYVPFGGTFDAMAVLFDALQAAPGHKAALLPSGQASLEKLTETTIGEGDAHRTLTAYEITGLSFEPVPIWGDASSHFFGIVDPTAGLSMLPQGAEGELLHLQQVQADAIKQRSPAMLKRLLQPDTGPVAFVHAKIFDADKATFRSDMNVTVAKGKITDVTPSSAAPPAGARIIDARGKTLVPGQWDMHMHYGDDATGPLLLSLGVTSARDPGNNNALTIDRARRRAAGLLLSPHVYPSSLLDGKSPYTAQLGTAIGSLDEAVAAVRRAKADGFTGVKIYGSFNPAWVAPTAAEAHRLGLHVHGHVPAGMRPLDAVQDGYDEITHINFVMMQAMPQSVVDHSNTDQRMVGIGRYAADVDLAAPPIAGLVQTLQARHITVDPTLSVFESELVMEPGDLTPAYAPLLGTLPPEMERSFRAGGQAVPKGSSRAQFRRSFAKLQALVADLHAHHVRIVAGTDGFGPELIRELELYVAAGLTPAEALETATLDAARTVGVDRTTGSIDVGKTADLVLVEGDPAKHIGDLRQTRLVMLGGRLMDADALRTAAGFSGRPK